MSKKYFLVFLFTSITEYCFSQSDISISNTIINNTESHYGASNSIQSPNDPSSPTSVTTGDKFVEFISGNKIVLKPGFGAKASVLGGKFSAHISPFFTPVPISDNSIRL